VANRFHQAEGEFRARDGADILAARNQSEGVLGDLVSVATK
jgi:hypothetical protein